MTQQPLWIGTAGWNVPARYEVPAGGSQLERYALALNAVEINSSFYRPHQRKTYERWALATPEAFRFSVKMPRTITHQARLANCDAMLDRFIAEVNGLGDKLGVLLVQLPPKLAFNEQIAGGSFRTCKPESPRQSRWSRSMRAGSRRTWTHGLPSTGSRAWPPIPRAWTAHKRPAAGTGSSITDGTARRRSIIPTMTTLRWRRFGFVSTRAWKRGAQAWCIFDNTASGAAFGNALTLASSEKA